MMMMRCDDDNLLIYMSPLRVIDHIAICVLYQPSRTNWQLSLTTSCRPPSHAHSTPHCVLWCSEFHCCTVLWCDEFHFCTELGCAVVSCGSTCYLCRDVLCSAYMSWRGVLHCVAWYPVCAIQVLCIALWDALSLWLSVLYCAVLSRSEVLWCDVAYSNILSCALQSFVVLFSAVLF